MKKILAGGAGLAALAAAAPASAQAGTSRIMDAAARIAANRRAIGDHDKAATMAAILAGVLAVASLLCLPCHLTPRK